MTNQQSISQRIPYVAGGKILRYACSALCAAAFDKGITVGAFRYSGVGFVSAHTDAVQTAVVFADHVVLALGHGTVNVAVFLFDLHNDRSSSERSYRRRFRRTVHFQYARSGRSYAGKFCEKP